MYSMVYCRTMNLCETWRLLINWITIVYILNIEMPSFFKCEITNMQTLDINSQNYSQQRELYNIIHGYWITENSNHNNNINDINNTTYKDINSMHNPISDENSSKYPANITVQEHTKHVRFDCHIRERNKISSYRWLKNGIDINFYPDIQNRYQILPNGSLYLKQISRNDTGVYTCQSTLRGLNANDDEIKSPLKKSKTPSQDEVNHIGLTSEFSARPPGNYSDTGDEQPNMNTSIWLKVQYIPRVHFNTTENPIYLGKDGPGRLPCTIDASPSVDLIEWRKLFNSSDIIKSNFIMNHFQKRQKGGTILPVEQLLKDDKSIAPYIIYWYEWDTVKEIDAGYYQCRARNTIGWSLWSPQLQVIVNELPYFTKKPNLIEFVKNGQPVVLQCQASGHPKPVIHWYYTKSNPEERAWLDPLIPTTPANNDRKVYETELEDIEGQEDEQSSDDGDEISNSSEEIKQFFKEYMAKEKQSLVDYSLPNGVSKLPDGALHIFTENVSKITGQYFCIAENQIGRAMTPVELKQDFTGRSMDQIVYNIVLHVKPFIYSAFLSWNKESSLQSIDNEETQCYYVIYHIPVRSGEDWITTVVQPKHSNRIRLNGLIPNELYAFRISLWCTPSNQSYSSSSTVLIKTESPLKLTTGYKVQFEELEKGIPKPPTPHSLRLQIIQAEQQESVLMWKTQSNSQFSALHSNSQQQEEQPELEQTAPILFFQIEFIICTYLTNNLSSGLTNCSDSNIDIYQWRTLAPIRYPKLTFEINSHSKILDSTQRIILYENELNGADSGAIKSTIEHIQINSFLTNLYYDPLIYELRFRVRSIGLMSMSEPSNQLIIKHPLLSSILNSLNQTLHYEHYLIYRAIRQSLHNSKQHHNQQSSPTSIDEASTKTTRNNTQLVSDNNYHTHKQIKGYWYIYCIILVSGFLALFLLVFIPQKVFRKYKRKVQNRKNTNVSEYQMVSNSCQPPGRHLLLQTSHENTLNNQYYPHDSLVYRSPDLVYNPKKYAVNEFNQRHKPVDVNNSDFEVYTKHEEVNPYDEQTLLQPYDLHVTSPKEYQIKPNDESFEQVYLIISSHNNTYSNNNINNNTRCCSLSPLNRQQTTVSNQDSYVHNVWNKRKNTDEIKESDGKKHSVMEPLLFRSENMNPAKPTLTRYPVSETNSSLQCKCLPASNLKLYTTYANYKSPTQIPAVLNCSCQEKHLTSPSVQQRHQYEHSSLKYSIIPSDILTMSLPRK